MRMVRNCPGYPGQSAQSTDMLEGSLTSVKMLYSKRHWIIRIPVDIGQETAQADEISTIFNVAMIFWFVCEVGKIQTPLSLIVCIVNFFE